MRLKDLLSRLNARGITLSVDGDAIRYRAPQGGLTDTLRDAIRQHKPELLGWLRGEPSSDTPTPCPVCGDLERWPTDNGPVCVSCYIESIRPQTVAAGEWMVPRNLDPQSIKVAYRRYLAETHGGQMPDWPPGKQISRFNAWLEARGERPTTLRVWRQAVGIAPGSESDGAGWAVCSRCYDTNWGPSGRLTDDGAEVWHCRACADAGVAGRAVGRERMLEFAEQVGTSVEGGGG